MAMTAFRSAIHGGSDARLAPGIAAVLLVKIVGLAVIWLLFVRDQRPVVDARSTAMAFGLAGAPSDSNPKPEGQAHGR